MIKVIKLNEASADAKKKPAIGKAPENALEAWDRAKNVKQMDDAAAWAVNDITTDTLGDRLQEKLKPGTLSRFVQAISWPDLYKENTFTNFLRKHRKTLDNDLVSYLANDKNSDDPGNNNLKQIKRNTKGFESVDELFQLLYNGSLNNLYNPNDSVEVAIDNCVNGKRGIEDRIESDKNKKDIENLKKNVEKMSTEDRQAIYNALKNDKEIKK